VTQISIKNNANFEQANMLEIVDDEDKLVAKY